MPKQKTGAAESLDADWKRTSNDMLEKFIEHVTKLWKQHFIEAKTILDESESSAIKLNFTAKMDFSESEAKLESTIRFSEVHTDSKDATFDNPMPGPEPAGEPLPFVDEDAKAESKRLKAEKRKRREEKESNEPAHIVAGAE